MPATAGRVRMPANNRVHSSAALQTHGIWQSAIGYDPYAPNKEDNKNSQAKSAAAEPEGENSYASFQGLLALARITNSNADVARGACKKCGRVGHLGYQCRNFLSIKDENKEKDGDVLQMLSGSGLDSLKGNKGKIKSKNGGDESSDESSEEEDSDSSDSDVDSDIERIISQRYGKKASGKETTLKKKKEMSDDDSSDSDSVEKKKKRGRSKKRSSVKKESSDSDDRDESRRKRRKEKSRKRVESSDEDDEHRKRHSHRKSRKEKRRRRSHRHSDDSDESDDSAARRYKRKSRRAASDSDSSSSGATRVGRGKKRSEKGTRKRRHEDFEQ